MNKVLLIGGHGLGDCLMALQCAVILKRQGIEPTIYMGVRDEIYQALTFLFGPRGFKLQQINEQYTADNALLKDVSIMPLLSKGFDEVYYVIPDLLFNNKYAFDCKKYHTSPQSIRSIRLLEGQATTNTIYLGLMTTTDGYAYNEPLNLATSLAYHLPDYTIYLPTIDTWANKFIPPIDTPALLSPNLRVVRNPSFEEALSQLLQSCYFLGTDNGPSHVAYHAGIPRLLLDPQYNKLPWIARWREDYLESVPITLDVDVIVNIVYSNITTPQTTLVPRIVCAVQGRADWNKLLWLKTE